MIDITPEQRAIIKKLDNLANYPGTQILLRSDEANELYAVLPHELTTLHSAVPTEPGWYLDVDQEVLTLEKGRWYTGSGDEVDPVGSGPFTRLVPERPQVTVGEVFDKFAPRRGGSANVWRGIADFINGVDQ